MNILMTGASGFLGSRIRSELEGNHALTTLGRQTISQQHIRCDLVDETPQLKGYTFDVVIHAAGKAHAVPRTSQERGDYERVNVQGTVRLLTALEQLPVLPQAIVYISTVLAYGRSEGQLLDEKTSLNATDVYGLSKARAEALVCAWGERTGVRVAILRLPLVAAREPTGNLAAMMNGLRRGYYVRIGDGAARRSMVRADDVAAVVLKAAAVGGIYNLTDGCHPSVYQLEEAMARLVGRNRIPTVPLGVAKAVANVGDGINGLIGRRFPLDSMALRKLTSSLTFSDEAARQHLDWNPRAVLDCFR